MARRTIVKTIDDLTGEPGAETVTIGLNGRTIEIDLGPKNRTALTKALEPFLAAGRPVRSPTNVVERTTASPRRLSPTEREQLQAVRAWWVVNYSAAGLPEPSDFHRAGRGRIPSAVTTAYQQHDGKKVRAARRKPPAATVLAAR